MRQLAYSAGRISTYTFLGAMAGFCGMRLTGALPLAVHAAAILCVVAGVVLIYEGLVAARVLPNLLGRMKVTTCVGAPFLKPLLAGGRLRDVFAAGIMTGLLPCGLLYAFVALAASSGSLFAGALLMTAFGVGTAPLMILGGWSGSLLSGEARRRLYLIAALCVILTGALSVARGAGFIQWSAAGTTGCPLCADKPQ
jgi:sulfite exporter TauE/SafE